MKKIKLEPILDPEGNKLVIPDRDIRGNLKFRGVACPACSRPTEVELVDTDSLLDLLTELVLYRIPIDQYTRKDSHNASEVLTQIHKCRHNSSPTLDLSDEIHKWLRTLLDDDKIGARTFRHNLPIIEEALDNFERLHEKAE